MPQMTFQGQSTCPEEPVLSPGPVQIGLGQIAHTQKQVFRFMERTIITLGINEQPCRRTRAERHHLLLGISKSVLQSRRS